MDKFGVQTLAILKYIKCVYSVDNSDPGCDDRIELKVFGITCPGSQITHDLVELLERKLVTK